MYLLCMVGWYALFSPGFDSFPEIGILNEYAGQSPKRMSFLRVPLVAFSFLMVRHNARNDKYNSLHGREYRRLVL